MIVVHKSQLVLHRAVMSLAVAVELRWRSTQPTTIFKILIKSNRYEITNKINDIYHVDFIVIFILILILV